MPDDTAPADLNRLDRLIERLRAPDGCPWDRKQTMPDLRAYLLEEAHELADAMDREEPSDLLEELGDLLFQAVFVGRLASERGLFRLGDAIEHVERKMIERHPHVFGDETLTDSAAVEAAWERRKLARSLEDPSPGDVSGRDHSALRGVPATLPALLHAYRVGQKAGALGFDWERSEQVLEKVREELAEVEDALATQPAADESGPIARVQGAAQEPVQEATREATKDAVREELGDLLLAVAHLARHLEVDPESALAAANRKFARRFRAMESQAAGRGLDITALDAEAWERLWTEAKQAEANEAPSEAQSEV